MGAQSIVRFVRVSKAFALYKRIFSFCGAEMVPSTIKRRLKKYNQIHSVHLSKQVNQLGVTQRCDAAARGCKKARSERRDVPQKKSSYCQKKGQELLFCDMIRLP